MLVSLAIRDVVLIERLDLAFEDGLTVLTGETGAGKSILLDSLGMALGARADSGLVRSGADRAQVTAAFDLPADHPVRDILAEAGLDANDPLILRRQLSADGRSRAYINDQPASVGLLRQVGDTLADIHGQFDQRGLLDPATHLGSLDAYGRTAPLLGTVAARWRAYSEARAACRQAAEDLAAARTEEAALRHAVEELDTLAPEAGEEARLSEARALMMHAEKLAEAIQAATQGLQGDGTRIPGVETALASAGKHLERVADLAGERMAPVIHALDRASSEVAEALALLAALAADMDFDPAEQERTEDRLFALRSVARKHGVAVDALADLRASLSRRLAMLDDSDTELRRLAEAEASARETYLASAQALSLRRTEAAKALDEAVMAELPPLKLDKARFATRIDPAPETEWGPRGVDFVAFEVATNPGSSPGPIGKIASGGELSRFMLALKVVLAGISDTPTLVFDEVDSGIGGATADAVGERLARLARSRQVLVVTHSPQVAARGLHHLTVQKHDHGVPGVAEVTRTNVRVLDSLSRREEIARMLSGTEITEEARAQATRLLEAGTKPSAKNAMRSPPTEGLLL